MGRNKTVTKAGKMSIERYYAKFGNDFHVNKRVFSEIATIPTKRTRNQIAGFITHTMKRIEKGPVRGVSIKLQEEERERRDNYMPVISVVDPHVLSQIKVDADTKAMIDGMELNIPSLVVDDPKAGVPRR